MSDNREMIVLNGEQIDELVRCKDCKHRPIDNGVNHAITPKVGEDDWDYTCPCICYDEYYSWYPPDDFYCGKGERREDG